MFNFKFQELTFAEVRSFLAKKGFFVGCFYMDCGDQGYCHSNLAAEGSVKFKGGYAFYGSRR